MALKQWIFRLLRTAAFAVLAILLLLYAAIKIEMFILRHRAEALMADMHQIHLYQSTWADAQKLMTRWGRWGQYDGACTSTQCLYRIKITESGNLLYRLTIAESVNWFFHYKLGWLMGILGDRGPALITSFTIRDGKIVRTTAFQSLTVSPWLPWTEELPYDLFVNIKSHQRLRRTKEDFWVLGSRDQLAQHPNFLVGRPGGCEICKEVTVTYATHTSQAEIQRLTSFNFSCYTRLLSCREIEDVLPAASGWRIYHDDETFAIEQQHKSDPPIGCDIPLWAMARDQANIYLADALSVTTKQGLTGPYEVAMVKPVEALKGKLPSISSEPIEVVPFAGDLNSLYPEKPEHLEPGKRFILFPAEDEHDLPIFFDSKNEKISLPRCGVHPDTVENRSELKKGFTQNDTFADSDGRVAW